MITTTTTSASPASEAVTNTFELEGSLTPYGSFAAAVEASDDTCDGLTTEWYIVEIVEIARDASGEEIDRTSHEHIVACHPTAPPCTRADGHDWQQPHRLVGGLEDNPGVYGSGGGVAVHYACVRCGCGRVRDDGGTCTIDGSACTVETYTPDEYADQLESDKDEA